MSRSMDGVEEGGRLEALKALCFISGERPRDGGDQPLSLEVTDESFKNNNSVCGVLCGTGLYKQSLSPYMSVVSIQI